MNAIVVEEYGDVEHLVHKKVKKPSAPVGYDVLVECVPKKQKTDCAMDVN